MKKFDQAQTHYGGIGSTSAGHRPQMTGTAAANADHISADYLGSYPT